MTLGRPEHFTPVMKYKRPMYDMEYRPVPDGFAPVMKYRRPVADMEYQSETRDAHSDQNEGNASMENRENAKDGSKGNRKAVEDAGDNEARESEKDTDSGSGTESEEDAEGVPDTDSDEDTAEWRDELSGDIQWRNWLLHRVAMGWTTPETVTRFRDVSGWNI